MLEGNRHLAGRRPARVFAVAVVAALSLGAAACSSSPSAVTFNHTQAKTDIGNAYDTLFHFSSGTLASKEAVIQNGTTLAAAMNQALHSSEAGAAGGAKVDSVTFLSATQCTAKSLPSPCAHVVYDILGPSGTAILPNNNGYSVLTNGKWLVAKTTICTLLGLFYTAEGKTGSPPGC
jgi:hypothetical protein